MNGTPSLGHLDLKKKKNGDVFTSYTDDNKSSQRLITSNKALLQYTSSANYA